MEFLKVLNKSQNEAVVSNSRFIRVIAGAGSGKTRVLASRITYLIQEFGIAPRSILAITFTNKVANHMKERVCSLLEVESTQAFISTYHSFCLRLLREDIGQLGYSKNFMVIDEEEKEKIIKNILNELNLSKEIYPVNSLINYISNHKTIGFDSAKALEGATGFIGEKNKALVYQEYEKTLDKYFYLDFDDLIWKAVKILKEFKEVRDKWQNRYQHILVDEFQDTNDIQFDLLTLLVGKNCSLFVVGDPDQTIYTWRGANVSLILDFKKQFGDVQDILLDMNYRSTKNILSAANALIINNKNRLPKELKTDNEGGGKILYYQGGEADLEAAWVGDRIKELVEKNLNIKHRDIAILYRSNYYSRSFEKELNTRRIPYRIFGGIRFFERKEVKDAIAYLRLLVKTNDDMSFERIINVPRRGIGDKSLNDMKIRAQEMSLSLYESITKLYEDEIKLPKQIEYFAKEMKNAQNKLASKEVMYGTILEELLESIGYYTMLRNDKDTDRLDNLKELSNYIFDFQANNPDSSLLDLIQEIALYSAQDDIVDGDYVSMMTIHTAKGLEFPYVFLVGMSEGVFPSARSIVDRNDGLEEERRLAYVAMTRAMKQLFLSGSLGFNYATGSIRTVSRFINEIGDLVTPYYSKKIEPPRMPYFATIQQNPVQPVEINKAASSTYRAGEAIVHKAFGEGIVVATKNGVLTVAFKDTTHGIKMISETFNGIHKKV